MLQYSNFKMFIVFVFLLGTGSCAEQKNTQVVMYGISFDCPSGWKVKETKDYGTAKYISIEKKGASSSGLVIMSFTENDFEPDEYLDLFRKSYQKSYEERNFTNLVFKQTEETCYGKYKGIASFFTFEVASVKHEGKIYVFKEKEITMCAFHQEAVEDHKRNLQGFETIMNSLVFD